MKVNQYPLINEQLYYEKLPNGLQVFIVPKENYNKTYALFATKYGSIDNRFVPYGKDEYVTMPLGIAHFLEHKLFETKEGDDAANLLSSLAKLMHTLTTTTAYLFSATHKIPEALNILLDFVQDPYFTDKNVLKNRDNRSN